MIYLLDVNMLIGAIYFEPTRNPAEQLCRNLSGNIRAGLFRTIFHLERWLRDQADNSLICTLPNWPKNIE